MNPGSELAHARIHWIVESRKSPAGKFTRAVEKFDLLAGAAALRDMLRAKGLEAHVRELITPARKPRGQRPLI